jgi:hypothetical protein
MQRIGRVNRIGSVAGEIYNYMFYPSAEGDAQIQLYKNALIKLQGFHSAFGEDASGPAGKTKYDSYDYRMGAATHGYLPDKGPQPVFAAKGPGIKPNVTLERGLLVDQAPTFAELLGLSLPNADGSVIWDILLDSK